MIEFDNLKSPVIIVKPSEIHLPFRQDNLNPGDYLNMMALSIAGDGLWVLAL